MMKSFVIRQIDRRMRRWAQESYQRNWRQRTVRKSVALGLTLLRQPGWLTHRSAASFYTSKTPYATDPATPLWSNLGYWKRARTVVDAQIELARYLAEAAQLAPGDEVLDAGCGSGDQDILWCRERRVKRITGIDVTPVRAELANARAVAAGCGDRIRVHVGSATNLEFPDSSFDKVTALESAMHFPTREDFFREAFRVLRPGGRIAITDLAEGPGGPTSVAARLLQRFQRRMSSIPEANVYSASTDAAKLAACGFSDIVITSIGDYVFPGCVRYCAMLARGGSASDAVDLSDEHFHGDEWNSRWRDGLGIGDYVIVTAIRPLS
jgi:microcystin synthetase protein McyJ